MIIYFGKIFWYDVGYLFEYFEIVNWIVHKYSTPRRILYSIICIALRRFSSLFFLWEILMEWWLQVTLYIYSWNYTRRRVVGGLWRDSLKDTKDCWGGAMKLSKAAQTGGVVEEMQFALRQLCESNRMKKYNFRVAKYWAQ